MDRHRGSSGGGGWAIIVFLVIVVLFLAVLVGSGLNIFDWIGDWIRGE